MAYVRGDVHHVGLSYLCGLRKKEKRGSHLHTNNNTRWHFPRFEKRTSIYCFLLVFVNSFGSSSSSSSIIWEREREREWRVGTRDKALIFWTRMQMWGLVTFARDMALAFYVRNFQETFNPMDVWTYGWGDLEMILS